VDKTAYQFYLDCPETIKVLFDACNSESGQTIMEQGEDAAQVHILVEGEAKVIHTTIHAIEYLVYIYSPTEIFGEVEAINNKPLVSSIQASGLCKTVSISNEDFLFWMKTDPEFSLFISRQLADKLYETSLTSAVNITSPLRYRVLYYLWNANQQGQRYIPKKDVIAGLGSNERSINRVLKSLINEMVIDYEGGLIRVAELQDLVLEMKKYE
jgi:CRP-like cAMP-binding protein